VTEHRQQTTNDTIPLSKLQCQQTTCLPIHFKECSCIRIGHKICVFHCI